MKFLSSAPQTKKALIDFKAGYEQFGATAKEALHKLYITDNPNPTGSKHLLDFSEDGSVYSAVHKENMPWLRNFLVQRDYYDIFLIDTNGNVVFTVFKELDFATNVLEGEWKDTDIGNAFREAIKTPNGEVHFFDFKPYKPSFDVPASFISTRIDDEAGNPMGVLVFQMPVAKLNAVFANTDGLGETGEICLYGADYKMRNNSRFSKEGETTILKREWKVDHIDESIEGESDYQVGPNYDGKEVLLAHSPFEWKGTKYALISTVSIEEFNIPLEHLKRQIIQNVGVALIVCAVLGWLVARTISRNISRLAESVSVIAKGQDADVPLKDSKDELGDIARSLETINDVGKAAVRVQNALDNVKGYVFMTDNDGKINYINQTMLKMLRSREGDIKSTISDFSADALIGKPLSYIDSSGETPSTVRLGSYIFDTISGPVNNAKGEKIGVVLEWSDVTELRKREQMERAIQQEVETIVQASAAGDFSQRLATHGREGFMLKLCDGMNRISSVSEAGLNEIKEVMTGLADGDLTRKIDGDYQGMFDDIKLAINNTIDKLKETASEIKAASGSVSTSAGEISASSVDLSRRTETQASTLEQTAASMEEITGTVKSNSKNAQDANLFANDAKGVAEEGGQMVKQVVGAMEKISASSTKIADIIGVIDEIAFQTNLLALNAAVEAARAGDAGKGFAVVADEVRALAGRSSQASKEIKELISQSVNQVKDGSALVDKAGQTLGKVVESFNKVASLISEITVAGEEQSQGINEINSAVSQLDAATQENAAMVEETTASAQTLSELAVNLNELVGFFKLDENDAHAAKPAAPAQKKITGTANAKVKPAAAAASKPKVLAKAPVAASNEGWEEF